MGEERGDVAGDEALALALAEDERGVVLRDDDLLGLVAVDDGDGVRPTDLRERVALLKGLPVSVVGEVLDQRITLTPGGRELVATMRANGAWTCLISGGFTLFTNTVAARIGFQENRANELIADDGKFSGKVVEPILGKDAKLAALTDLREQFEFDNIDTLAVGDGANDLPMIKAAGLGVAYHAKPVVAAAAAARIDHGDLTALLYAQGYRREEFVG